MRSPRATITTPLPTRRRESQSASAACRIRATDRGGGRPAARTRSPDGTAAVLARDRSRRFTARQTLRPSPDLRGAAAAGRAERPRGPAPISSRSSAGHRLGTAILGTNPRSECSPSRLPRRHDVPLAAFRSLLAAAMPHRMSFSWNVFCSQVAIGRAGDRNALRGRLTMRMVFLATIECRGKSRKADGEWQKTRVTATRSRRMRRSRRRADYRPTSSTSRNPPRPIDTLSRFLLAMHRYPRASPKPLLRLAS